MMCAVLILWCARTYVRPWLTRPPIYPLNHTPTPHHRPHAKQQADWQTVDYVKMNLLDNVQPNPTVVNTVTDTQVCLWVCGGRVGDGGLVCLWLDVYVCG